LGDRPHHNPMAAAELARVLAEIARLRRRAAQLMLDDDGRAMDAAELAAGRDYAQSARDSTLAEVVSGCARALRLYGWAEPVADAEVISTLPMWIPFVILHRKQM
jgi:hypothetical protein